MFDTLIIGGGQSALACDYYMRRTKLDYLLLDNQERCGGAWLHACDSLTLFSPAEASSLPGRLMPMSSHDYPTREEVIVGEGNSGAQILAEVSKVADTRWATTKEPTFLPDDVDGRVLFNRASAKYYAEQKGESFDTSKLSLGNIVMVPSVKEARDHGVLESDGKISEIKPEGVVWENGKEEKIDVIIWCTGFHYATDHLRDLVPLGRRGKVDTQGTRATEVEGLWLVGYGGWTGFASATLKH